MIDTDILYNEYFAGLRHTISSPEYVEKFPPPPSGFLPETMT